MGGHGIDVLRHEATHQLDLVKGITDVRILEINAYTTNLLNPASRDKALPCPVHLF